MSELTTKLTVTDAIHALAKEEQVDLNEQHLFADGMYCRHGMMPSGSLIIGHEHAKTSINVFSQGRMLIKMNMEDEWEEVSAPFVNSTEAGSRKIIYTLTDCYFMNIFRTNNTDLDDLYDECVVREEGTKPCLEADKVKALKEKTCG